MSFINETEKIFEKTLRGSAGTSSGRKMNAQLEEWRERYKQKIGQQQKQMLKISPEQAKVMEQLSETIE